MKPVKVGIASFAHVHAASYARVLSSMDGVDVTAFCDPMDRRAIAMEEQFHISRVANFDVLAASDDVDLVLITCETTRHADIAIAAMEHGKDVIIEKPIAATMEDARRIVASERKHGRRVFQCYPCRYHPSSQHVKKMIETGEMGRISGISATNHGCIPSHGDPETRWFSQKALAGGGAIMDHATHAADLIFWFTGWVPERVFGVARTVFHHDIDVDDAGMILVQFTDDVAASIDPSWSRPVAYPTWGNLTMTIHGERATVAIDMFNQNLDLFSSKQPKNTTWLPFGDDVDGAMLSSFIDAWRRDDSPPVSSTDGIKALQVALRAYDSATAGTFVAW